ncbi:hypothetical protein GLYMA_14G141600v4 [Glycine max]|uniref:Uncharacterized protein n=1 Tax=Glycine max TaxID=3847 RepID=A0A0R0GCW7_SOYBN|nr:hypothetical protein GYH30_039943 [Glycine max]KRH16225.1 hypothetical protein GLYMA_14G141600v4 [Glycine max]
MQFSQSTYHTISFRKFTNTHKNALQDNDLHHKPQNKHTHLPKQAKGKTLPQNNYKSLPSLTHSSTPPSIVTHILTQSQTLLII